MRPRPSPAVPRYALTLGRLAARGGLALYGAGHLTGAFVNLHGLAPRFRFVVDDTPQKQGLYLPGTGLPIVPGDALAGAGIGTCLFGLAPEMEAQIAARNEHFTAKGGRFASILAASERSLRQLLPEG